MSGAEIVMPPSTERTWVDKAIRAGAVVCALLALGAILLVQWNGHEALRLSDDVVDDSQYDRRQYEDQIAALRASRDEWVDEARQANEEKVAINCVQIGYLSGFATAVSTILAGSESLTPEEVAILEPYTEPPPNPQACPPREPPR